MARIILADAYYMLVPAWILIMDIPDRAKVVWHQLSLGADIGESKRCVRTQTVADNLGCSVSTVRRAIKDLIENKIIISIPKNGTYKYPVYLMGVIRRPRISLRKKAEKIVTPATATVTPATATVTPATEVVPLGEARKIQRELVRDEIIPLCGAQRESTSGCHMPDSSDSAKASSMIQGSGMTDTGMTDTGMTEATQNPVVHIDGNAFLVPIHHKRQPSIEASEQERQSYENHYIRVDLRKYQMLRVIEIWEKSHRTQVGLRAWQTMRDQVGLYQEMMKIYHDKSGETRELMMGHVANEIEKDYRQWTPIVNDYDLRELRILAQVCTRLITEYSISYYKAKHAGRTTPTS